MSPALGTPLQDRIIFRRAIKQNHWKTIAARKGLPCFMFEEILRVKNMFTFKRVRVTLELGLGWLDPFNIIFHTFFFSYVFFFSSFLLRLGEPKGTNIVFRAQKGSHTNQHPPPHQKKPRPRQSPRRRPHQPMPTPT